MSVIVNFPLPEDLDPHARSLYRYCLSVMIPVISCPVLVRWDEMLLTGHVAKSSETRGSPPFSKFPANLLGKTQFGCFFCFLVEYHQKWNGICADLNSNSSLQIKNPYLVLKNTDCSKKDLVLYGKLFIKYADLQ